MTKQRMTALLFLFLGIGISARGSAATTFYISKSGDNTTGLSWATAWSELNQVKWSSVNPGDVIKIGGGTYATVMTLSKAGTSSSRILIQRATESGHDGKVILPGMQVNAPFVSVDGVDKYSFEFYSPGSNMLVVDTHYVDDYFELKNAYFRGTPDVTCWGQEISVPSGSFSLQYSMIDKSQCSEDMIWFDSEPGGNLKIEHTALIGWVSKFYKDYTGCTGVPSDSLCWTHSDMVSASLCSMADSVCNQGDLTFRDNIVDDSGINTDDTHYGNIAFMTGYTNWGNVIFSGNVFKGTYVVFEQTSNKSFVAYNNDFYDTWGGFGSKNSIFDSSHEIIYGANEAPYSLFSLRTPNFNPSGGTTSIQADPKFLDPSNTLGPDGIPFTADDGFNLQANSPAINKGMPVAGLTTDIRGNVITGNPDVGAYEYVSGGPTPTATPTTTPASTMSPTPTPTLTPTVIPTPTPTPAQIEGGFLSFKNVFNPEKESITINYSLSGMTGDTTLAVYDRQGSKVKELNPNTNSAIWDGRNSDGQIVASGTYVLILKKGNNTFKKKVVVK